MESGPERQKSARSGAAADPCVTHFLRHLRSEKNASEHTVSAYALDLGQFVAQTWGAEAKPPYAWGSADAFAARRYVVELERRLRLPVALVSVGPGRDQTIERGLRLWS